MKDEHEATPITVSELRSLLAPLKKRYRNTRSESYQIYTKTLEYAEMFCKIEDKSAISDLKSFMTSSGLTSDEVAILGTLLPQSVDEAKIYIPTLSRLSDVILRGIIEKIQCIYL